MAEIDMRADGVNTKGERTYTVRVNKNTYHNLTLNEAMVILKESEEKKK